MIPHRDVPYYVRRLWLFYASNMRSDTLNIAWYTNPRWGPRPRPDWGPDSDEIYADLHTYGQLYVVWSYQRIIAWTPQPTFDGTITARWRLTELPTTPTTRRHLNEVREGALAHEYSFMNMEVA